MQFFDTHAHIGLISNDPIERLITLKSAKKAGVEAIIAISNNLIDFEEIYQQLAMSPNLYFAAGISPTEVEHKPKEWMDQLEAILERPKVVAVGETGLDYVKKSGSRSQQIELFIKHLQLAQKSNKPVIIHNREAGDEILDVLSSYMPSRGAVLHCFCEDAPFALKAIEQFEHLYISFAGNLTWKTSYNLHKAAVQLPIERILVESESPFMKPSAYHDQRTKPAFIHSTVEFLAHLRDEPLEDVARTLFDNAKKLFQI
ncbi:TatD family hydrolase [Entomospira culicis]|uniref:TatD family hydrolase n=1 Tax=Entomospira culicis TaxID=2719989 RepID=A0A968KZ39_9SPIO|nr:TatD family hydrolase [Entomospira culicis]NIZ18716.1 TatD family hydrolase [Entomospira culicis]NIZ68931.1 TatD family hydrolase [Entomospira culicis]WDI37524.1 TatD family hydrolase [Entomospira culicis]WDI39152.1 TatD family hydrolase [Entomospira culicis]